MKEFWNAIQMVFTAIGGAGWAISLAAATDLWLHWWSL